MALTKEQIESVYSRIPFLPRPANVFVLENADVGAENLYDSVHRLNAIARQETVEKYHILGMTPIGQGFVLVAGDAPSLTVVHEGVHAAGVRNEQATRLISRALYARAQTNLGLMVKPVRYEAVPVAPAERDGFLRTMHLNVAPGQAGEIELLHLVYTP